MYKILFSRSAKKAIDKISINDKDRIRQEIEKLKFDPRPRNCKKLRNRDAYRIRIGNYRAIYRVIDEFLVVDIVKIGHRKNIY
ncbi:MAG: hypothetical protein Kapaf2KO_03820 [Candidatus Kapaibacteriales bacterium]